MIDRVKLPTYLILTVILAGCNSVRNQATTREYIPTRSLVISLPTNTLTVIPQATSTQPSTTSALSLIPTPEPSQTQTTRPSQTQTPEPNSTSTLELSNPAIPVCAGKGQIISPSPSFGITGTIVYQRESFHGLYTIGGTPLTQGEIASQSHQYTVYGFSSGGKWLAYAPELDNADSGDVVFHTPVMILLSAAGERREQMINVEGLEKELENRCVGCGGFHVVDSYGEWINDRLIYINLFARSNIENDPYSSLPKVFDPFTGAWQDQWFNNLPDVFTIFPTRVKVHDMKLSPDLSRLLYPADTGGIILRDMVKNVEVWSDREFYNPDSEVISWSQDSKMVAVTNIFDPKRHRLLLISRDGEVTELVNAEYPQPDFFAGSLSWSPNNQFLAFAVTLGDEVNLYLYDTQSMSYLYRCPLPGIIGGYPRLIWSPDQQWVAFSDEPVGSLRLLNVQSGEVIELLKDANPVGWSDKFPVEGPKP